MLLSNCNANSGEPGSHTLPLLNSQPQSFGSGKTWTAELCFEIAAGTEPHRFSITTDKLDLRWHIQRLLIVNSTEIPKNHSTTSSCNYFTIYSSMWLDLDEMDTWCLLSSYERYVKIEIADLQNFWRQVSETWRCYPLLWRKSFANRIARLEKGEIPRDVYVGPLLDRIFSVTKPIMMMLSNITDRKSWLGNNFKMFSIVYGEIKCFRIRKTFLQDNGGKWVVEGTSSKETDPRFDQLFSQLCLLQYGNNKWHESR